MTSGTDNNPLGEWVEQWLVDYTLIKPSYQLFSIILISSSVNSYSW